MSPRRLQTNTCRWREKSLIHSFPSLLGKGVAQIALSDRVQRSHQTWIWMQDTGSSTRSKTEPGFHAWLDSGRSRAATHTSHTTYTTHTNKTLPNNQPKQNSASTKLTFNQANQDDTILICNRETEKRQTEQTQASEV